MKRIITIMTLPSLAAVLAIPALSQAAYKKVKNEIGIEVFRAERLAF